jgi:hypothetical protein
MARWLLENRTLSRSSSQPSNPKSEDHGTYRDLDIEVDIRHPEVFDKLVGFSA